MIATDAQRNLIRKKVVVRRSLAHIMRMLQPGDVYCLPARFTMTRRDGAMFVLDGPVAHGPIGIHKAARIMVRGLT